jgi:rubrerythrin
MDIFLDASDVLQFAIRIEENGEAFYRKAASIVKDGEVKKLFDHLADEEIKHREFFKHLLDDVGRYRSDITFTDEYMAYIKDYADSKVVFTKEVMEEKLSRVKDEKAALDLAIQMELDSILYYHEIKGFIIEREHKTIDRIIEEERRHFNRLSEIKKGHKRDYY